MLSSRLHASSRATSALRHPSPTLARRNGSSSPTAAAALLKPTHSIYVSESTNPYFNLSLEDWLFRHKPHTEPLLLLYRDAPCVVIGRNQNPWKEVNFPALRAAGVPFIRRRSGGGTVYHDLGNTNFSIHLARTAFDRGETGRVVLRAVQSLGLDGRLNDRNDLCVGPHKHVSGSAYKIVNSRAYHHGTMLISTRLDTLGDLLRTNKETMITKGVASVRSPVCNLQQHDASVSHERFVRAVELAFRGEYDIDVDEEVQYVREDESTLGIEDIAKGMAELPSWEWAYGQTPEFTYTVQKSFDWGEVKAEIRSKHGIILSCALDVALPAHGATDETIQPGLAALGDNLKDRRYGFLEEGPHPPPIAFAPPVAQVYDWLKLVMST